MAAGRIAHTLKGSAATLGLVSLSEAADMLEKTIKTSPQQVDPSILKIVNQPISDYDFPKALEILKSVYKRLKK